MLQPLLLALATARPLDTDHTNDTQRLLIVARQACHADDPTLYSADLFSAHLTQYAPSQLRTRPFRLLNYEETCGPRWSEAVLVDVLRSVGAGGSVVGAGRVGGRVCGGVSPALLSLGRPLPGSCSESPARAAAVSLLARSLGWRRVSLLVTGVLDECSAALLRVQESLVTSGVLVKRALPRHLEDSFSIRPHALIICGSAMTAAILSRNVNKIQILILNVIDPEVETSLKGNGTKTIDKQSANVTGKERSMYQKFHFGELSKDSLNVIREKPLLLLSDRQFEVQHLAKDNYDEIIKALLNFREAEITRMEKYHHVFHLYSSITKENDLFWKQRATLNITTERLLDNYTSHSTLVNIDALKETELEEFKLEGAFDETVDAKVSSGTDAALHMTVFTLFVTCILILILTFVVTCLKRVFVNRMPKRSRAVPVLASTDFQFPSDEGRRVGEGMETMLTWLQQLHEFGSSEPERPDLLKRPEPLGQSAPSSTCSITRLPLDNRTRYKGDPVHMKYLPAASLELRRKSIDVLLTMQSLRHENVNSFIGCLTETRPALVFEACGRGSLEDVLMADDIRLDWTFRLSLLTDLVRGMRYLHSSPLRVHGRLTSRNCVVDSRWVLRVTDYGIPSFTKTQSLPHPPRTARELLWTAPELLREADSGNVICGTQPADVFSFAIIMQEVIVRGEPYCMLPFTPEEIIEKLTHPPPLIRPSVSMSAAPPEAVSVARQCWSEQPHLRPDFIQLYEVFRHMHRGRKVNIVDSMFEMLEKYSNNLEELIKERTEQLDMEKKKTEQLLNRMLPRTVAERLILGLRVEPEEFEEVSIYFSDIVGFTSIAARSTPVQVVDLLNDLYTTFDATIEMYRVYKVETIGDAYMVVGGLPIRSSDHAESVATMALHLLHLAGQFRIRHLPASPLHLRIGLHTGACCAGVVGLTMPRYCLFGDTVNTASRMESTGAAWRIQISSATAEKLAAAGGYRLRSRGLTQIKGKGVMHTFWLLGKEGFEKTLPTPPPLKSEEVLFEAESENDCDTNEAPPSEGHNTSLTQSVERQRSDPSPTVDRFSWRRSGAVSAESSPPGPTSLRNRYLRSSVSTVAGLVDTPRLSDRWTTSGSRVLRRQWSLERGDEPRYRTRRDLSTPDASAR
ncbi:receptor guanylyl cyclase GC-II [Danaus plexippus plexippus]|uniref:Guanylate cyclase n=1 Tax=Danaus plexippus plexippus TaxID=278856 RepID=A0A212EQ47_DANPL|nr:receptor guanylyl cyclase GC-II [Danaus plexippus plexippus]